ncbi:MAG: cytidylate kinase-like family protein [Anaerolineales bacterium]|jgi:cytidylate kinase
MAVITISRQLGSMADEVAQSLADRIGYRVVQCEIINRAARLAGTPEVALATIDDLDLFGFRPSQADRQSYNLAVRQIIDDLITEDDVILVCRSAQIILKNHPECFHVLVTATLETRAKRVAESQKIPIENASAQVIASDQSRQRDLQRDYDVQWDDPKLYDLVINTEHITLEQAVDIICIAINTPTRNKSNAEEQNLV